MKNKSQRRLWDKVSLGLGWVQASLGITEQPGASEAAGKRSVNDGCCHRSRAGIRERRKTEGKGAGKGAPEVPGRTRERDPELESASRKGARRGGVEGVVRTWHNGDNEPVGWV